MNAVQRTRRVALCVGALSLGALAAPPAIGDIQGACPVNEVPSAGFADAGSSVHAASIDCLAWWDIAHGGAGGRFDPAGMVRRDHMASFVSRTLELAMSLPTVADHVFADLEGSVHADAVARLAELGVVQGVGRDRYGPDRPVRRGQMATFLVRAWEAVTGEQLTATAGPHFADIAASPHAAAIDVAYERGWSAGDADGSYGPASPVRRGQMATFLARFLDDLVSEGLVEERPVPDAGPTAEVGVSDLPRLEPATGFAAPDQVLTMDTATSLADIAVGPDVIVLSRNDLIAILDKDGAVIGEDHFGSWWGRHVETKEGAGVGYGRIIWDPASRRFFLIAVGRLYTDPPCELGECVGDLYVAVSRTGSPRTLTASDWYFHQSQGALNNDQITRTGAGYVSANVTDGVLTFATTMFEYHPTPDGSPTDHYGGKLRMFDKQALLTAQDAEWRDVFQVPHPRPEDPTHDLEYVDHFAAPHRLDQDGPLLVLSESAWTCDVEAWEVLDPLDGPHLRRGRAESRFNCQGYRSDAVTFPGSGTGGREVPQPDGSTLWGEHHTRLFPQPVQQSGSIWGARTVSLAGGDDRSFIHWFEIDVSAWPDDVTMRQEGLLGAPGSWYDYPALSVDPHGNVGMIFRRAGADEWASAYVTGRLATDPLGTLRPSTLVAPGTALPAKPRWGYYYGAATDPVDGRIWLHGQYAGGPELTTYVVGLDLRAAR